MVETGPLNWLTGLVALIVAASTLVKVFNFIPPILSTRDERIADVPEIGWYRPLITDAAFAVGIIITQVILHKFNRVLGSHYRAVLTIVTCGLAFVRPLHGSPIAQKLTLPRRLLL